jgi:nitrous oxidase accessory protein NosD
MKKKEITNVRLRSTAIIVFSLFLISLPPLANAFCTVQRFATASASTPNQTWSTDCTGITGCITSTTPLQTALNSTATTAGNVLRATGTCDRVTIVAEKSGITLDGGGTGPYGAGGAVITGSDTRNNIILIQSATDVTITGFSLITGVGGGIAVNRASTAIITNNTIDNTGGFGVDVNEGSTARIGFTGPNDASANPNMIINNSSGGIRVGRGSSAWIAGNTIQDNPGNGITVFRVSQAHIASNTINHNNNGVFVSGNSGVTFGGAGTSFFATFFDEENSTTVNNTDRGVRCEINASVDGKLGSLNGAGGQTIFLKDCVNNSIP